MKQRRSILLTILAPLLAAPLVLVMWPEGPLDLSKDEEPFRSMVLPPKSIQATYYMDGGSVTLTVIDNKGTHHDVTFPINHGLTKKSYDTA